MIHLATIADAGDIQGKRVLLRCDLNDPVVDGRMASTFRIDAVLPTFDALHLAGARTIAFSHITKNAENGTLVPMWDYLNGHLPVKFCPTYFSAEADAMIADLKDGEILLFENIRVNPGEDACDMEFAKKLASYGDVYVNDAFSESHREQASITLLPALLPHYAGPLFVSEVENLSKAFAPTHPFVCILGGAKFATKLPLIRKFLETADTVFVAGALANDVFKVKGYETGTSLVSSDTELQTFGISECVNNPKFVCPVDVTVKRADGSIGFVDADHVASDEYIADVGPKTIEMLKGTVAEAQFVLWNGPLGNYEMGFVDKTEQLAEILAQSSAETVVGGGDTLSAIHTLDLAHKFTFVSTAGGAMLQFLADEMLPGIKALL